MSINEDINNAIALLEECIVNGKAGEQTLYAWFLGEQELIERTVEELNVLEKETNRC